jgi:hypothetical protein
VADVSGLLSAKQKYLGIGNGYVWSAAGKGWSERRSRRIVYFDDLTDGPVDSLTPKIVHSVQSDAASLRPRIDQAGKTLRDVG